MTAEQALSGVETKQWPMLASMNSKQHAQAWRDAGHAGDPPVAFRDGNSVRIDYQRLAPSDRQRVEARATQVPPTAGDQNVDARAGTLPRPPHGNVWGAGAQDPTKLNVPHKLPKL
jgi:hypothetical protein